MADRLTEEQLAALLDAEAKMTAGEWVAQTSNSMRRIGSGGRDGNVLHAFRAVDGVLCVAVRDDDLDGICLARNNLRALVEEVLELRAIVRAAHVGDRWETPEHLAGDEDANV